MPHSLLTQTLDFSLQPQNKAQLANLCGEQDGNISLVAERLNIEIYNRGYDFRLVGAPKLVKSGKKVLTNLYRQATHPLASELVHLQLVENLPRPRAATALTELPEARDEVFNQSEGIEDSNENHLLIRAPKKTIRTRNEAQRVFVEQIRRETIAFGVGPAGTGKTYLAVAAATEMLTSRRYERLIITRPAVEAGEKLGFLPGDFSQKVDPYLRPVFDALYETLGFELADNLLSRNVIEVAPLAFMRGRSFNQAFILLDEAQNTTVEQMKMFLTRMGFGSQVVVTGDPSQVDLPGHTTSGLTHALSILKDLAMVKITRFSPTDIVRHPLVQSVVHAYARDNEQHKTQREQASKRSEKSHDKSPHRPTESQQRKTSQAT